MGKAAEHLVAAFRILATSKRVQSEGFDASMKDNTNDRWRPYRLDASGTAFWPGCRRH